MFSSIEIEKSFVFNCVFYSRIEGLGMGSPFSPLLCDIYLHYFEGKLFSVYKFPYRLRYVDDILVLVLSNTKFSTLLALVNSIDHCIQITLETEKDNSLSFLDVLVSKDIDRLLTTFFRKSFSVSLRSAPSVAEW